MSEEYKKEVLEHMSIHQLIDTILINPTVHISPSYRDTGLSASYTFKPLSNLVYTRDQQVLFSQAVCFSCIRALHGSSCAHCTCDSHSIHSMCSGNGTSPAPAEVCSVQGMLSQHTTALEALQT